MAETVHFHLEAMLPALEDWQQRRLFTKAEVKQIVRRRTQLEYQLARRISRKMDYLKSIEFELNLQKQFGQRRDAQARKIQADKDPHRRQTRMKEWSQTRDSDTAIVRRIHGLFARALKKFAADTNLWVQYMQWASHVKSGRRLGRLYAEALQRHPRHIQFWLMAASYEADVQHNTQAARVLLQRALRINPDEPKLYLEYFKVELANVKRMRDRRQHLFGTVDAPGEPLGGSDSDNSDDSSAAFMVEDRVGDAAEERDPKLAEALAVQNPAQAEFYRASVPLAIARAAARRLPDNADLQLEFWRLLGLFGGDFSAARDQLEATLRRDFAASAPVQAALLGTSLALLLKCGGDAEQVGKCFAPLRRAIASQSGANAALLAVALVETADATVKDAKESPLLAAICKEARAAFSTGHRRGRDGALPALYRVAAASLLVADPTDSRWAPVEILKRGLAVFPGDAELLGLIAQCGSNLESLFDQAEQLPAQCVAEKAALWTAHLDAVASEPVASGLGESATAEAWRTLDAAICFFNSCGESGLRDRFAARAVRLVCAGAVSFDSVSPRLESVLLRCPAPTFGLLAAYIDAVVPLQQRENAAPQSFFGAAGSSKGPDAAIVRLYDDLLDLPVWRSSEKPAVSRTRCYLSYLSFILSDPGRASRVYQRAQSDKSVDMGELGPAYQSLCRQSGSFVPIMG